MKYVSPALLAKILKLKRLKHVDGHVLEVTKHTEVLYLYPDDLPQTVSAENWKSGHTIDFSLICARVREKLNKEHVKGFKFHKVSPFACEIWISSKRLNKLFASPHK
jgi:hypothetical protein